MSDITIQDSFYADFIPATWTTLYTTPTLSSMYKFYFLIHNTNTTTERIKFKFIIDSVELVWWNDDLVALDTLAISYPQKKGLVLPVGSVLQGEVDTVDKVTLILSGSRTNI